jgi:hypothetical protein
MEATLRASGGATYRFQNEDAESANPRDVGGHFHYYNGIVTPNPPAEPETRKGEGWDISASYPYGGKLHIHIGINTDVLKGISPREIADALAQAMRNLVQDKSPRLTALHPGSRRRLLTIQE